MLLSFFFGCLVATSSPANLTELPSIERVSISNDLQRDTYAVIGRTKKQFGTNYTINLRVTGSCFMGTCSGYKVEYASDYGYQRASYQAVFAQAGTYTVYVNGETYYFEF